MPGRGLALAVCALALVAAGARATRANEIHVAPRGHDSGAGTLASPYRTIRHALDAAGPGDTVYLHAGTYGESMSTDTGPIRGGSSWADALVIAAFPGDIAVLQPPRGADRVLMLADARTRYVVFRGLVLDARDVRYEGVKITWSSPSPANTSHHIRIEDTEVVNAPGQGLLVAGHHNELVRLRVYANGVSDLHHGIYVTSPDNLVEGCEVFHNAGSGVVVYNGEANDADRNVLRNNLVRHNARVGARGAGIGISSGEDNIALNNVVYGNRIGFQVDYDAIRSRILHNTVFAQPGHGLYVGPGASDTEVRNNLVFGNAPDYENRGARTAYGANAVGGDPGVVDAAAFDARLRATSRAVDAGEPLDAAPFDRDGTRRPQGAAPDLGAYEYRAPVR